MSNPVSLDHIAKDLLSPGVRQALLTRVRATLVREHFALLRSQLVPQVISELVVVWVAWEYADHRHLLFWLGAYIGIHHPIELWGLFHTKRHPIRDHQIKRWNYFARSTFAVNSLFWCYAYWAFGIGSPRENLFYLMAGGIMFISAQYSRTDLKMACAIVIPIWVTVSALHLGRGGEHDFILAVVFTLAFGVSFSLVIEQSKQTFDALYARLLSEEFSRVLQIKNDEVVRAKQEAEAASQAKSRFFAAASHDLRQPLHVLSLLTGSLRLNLRDEKNVQPTLQQMRQALDSLESLFDNVLHITQLESGKIDVNIGSASTKEIFEKLEREFKPLADSKGLRLRLRASTVVLETDELLLERILRNLISNAIKYTDSGGILIACRELTREGVATIHVIDTGIGIAADHLPFIFEDFYQAPSPTARQRDPREGVGLGLGIVKRLADKLNHPIEVRSKPHRGTTFTLRIPVSAIEDAGHGSAIAADEMPELSLTGRSILVVEDDASVASAIKTLLVDWDAQVTIAASRAELQRVLETLTSPPDFIIADFRIESSYTADDVIREVRQHFNTTIPCAVMTGTASLVPPHISRAEHVFIFTKPVSPAKLRALLHFNLVLTAEAV